MKTRARRLSGFTLVEIMIVVLIIGILSAIAVPALLHVKSKSEETLVLNTLRQLYDAKERYFLEDGVGKKFVYVSTLVKTGYASHSLDVATQHNTGAWGTSGLRTDFLRPDVPVEVSEVFVNGRAVSYGRKLTYPPPK
ncbi:MAG: type IV pilin protein [Opitutaceae bacterium]|jgi:type IV pilus assembly protein PilA